jgi:hypothetical protein
MERADYLDWLKEYLNNTSIEDIGIVAYVIDKMIDHDSSSNDNIKSKSIGDISITYRDDNTPYPKTLLKKLGHLKKVRW